MNPVAAIAEAIPGIVIGVIKPAEPHVQNPESLGAQFHAVLVRLIHWPVMAGTVLFSTINL